MSDDKIRAAMGEVLGALRLLVRDYHIVYDVGDLEMQPALWQADRAIATAEAALAEPVAPSDDGMPTSADERQLRRLLAVRVGIPGAYFDDGEAQGQQHGIRFDFMRDSVADLDAKLRALAVARIEAASPAPVVPCRDDGRCQYAIDHGAEGMGHCPKGKCAMPAPVAQPSKTEEQK